MSQLLLDADGDLDLTGGRLHLTTDLEAIDQALRGALALVRGEWFLDVTAGVDYPGLAWVKGASEARLRTAILAAARAVPGVLSAEIVSIALDRATRALTVSLRARTSAGPVDFSLTV